MKTITIEELNEILARPGTRVKMHWGTPNAETRSGCYIKTQLGMMAREFFVGLDVVTGEKIVEVL